MSTHFVDNEWTWKSEGGLAPVVRPQKAPTNDPRLNELLSMLTFKRKAWSKAEEEFIARFVEPLGAVRDEFGNYWLTIGESRILWSCHTDTVHNEGGRQKIEYGDNMIWTPDGECLGADDGAGVWLMAQMIRARVPGTYVFHRAEEIGAQGSDYIAEHCAERLAGLDFAIAFDRRGYTEVITHQMSRTASDAFGKSMCRALEPMQYVPSDKGAWTDTYSYAGIIPECSNIGVGYFQQHSNKEWLGVKHILTLADTLCNADFSQLVCAREPSDWDTRARSWSQHELWADEPDPTTTAPNHADVQDIEWFLYDKPDIAAMFLHACGYDVKDLERFEYDLAAQFAADAADEIDNTEN